MVGDVGNGGIAVCYRAETWAFGEAAVVDVVDGEAVSCREIDELVADCGFLQRLPEGVE